MRATIVPCSKKKTWTLICFERVLATATPIIALITRRKWQCVNVKIMKLCLGFTNILTVPNKKTLSWSTTR
jgi:hypothetical protein